MGLYCAPSVSYTHLDVYKRQFLKLIARCLELGKRALVLVPEISLTPQMILRLKRQFGRRVAVQHSALNHTERLLQWQMIQDGGADIVVGTRSAIFSPLENIGLIIVCLLYTSTPRCLPMVR